MIRARTYHGILPPGAILVRIVKAGEELAGFVQEVSEPGEEDTVYPSEQQPLDEVLRLVENKIAQMPEAEVYVELEAGIDWNPRWGELAG
jgi:hypothetical protein